MSAPVFSPAGAVSLQLVLTGMPRNLSAKKIEHYAERLRTVAGLITNESRGKFPLG